MTDQKMTWRVGETVDTNDAPLRFNGWQVLRREMPYGLAERILGEELQNTVVFRSAAQNFTARQVLTDTPVYATWENGLAIVYEVTSSNVYAVRIHDGALQQVAWDVDFTPSQPWRTGMVIYIPHITLFEGCIVTMQEMTATDIFRVLVCSPKAATAIVFKNVVGSKTALEALNVRPIDWDTWIAVVVDVTDTKVVALVRASTWNIGLVEWSVNHPVSACWVVS